MTNRCFKIGISGTNYLMQQALAHSLAADFTSNNIHTVALIDCVAQSQDDANEHSSVLMHIAYDRFSLEKNARQDGNHNITISDCTYLSPLILCSLRAKISDEEAVWQIGEYARKEPYDLIVQLPCLPSNIGLSFKIPISNISILEQKSLDERLRTMMKEQPHLDLSTPHATSYLSDWTKAVTQELHFKYNSKLPDSVREMLQHRYEAGA